MKIRFLRKVMFYSIVGVSLSILRCASSPAYMSPKTKKPSVNEHEKRHHAADTGSYLVGLWQGFWSLKGKVETDQFLFLEDGRWSWLATTDKQSPNTVQTVRRTGRWEMEKDAVVLAEFQRKEVVEYKRDTSSVRSCEDKSDCKACDAELRIVRHDTPIIERLVIGACPNNREASTLDREYKCLSLGERVFWRKAIPTKRELGRFFKDE